MRTSSMHSPPDLQITITCMASAAEDSAKSVYHPPDCISLNRLGDDVIGVLDAVKLTRPVLVGHSIAGEELSSIGSRFPDRVAGLVYLEAGYPYALYDSKLGDVDIDTAVVLRAMQTLTSSPLP